MRALSRERICAQGRGWRLHAAAEPFWAIVHVGLPVELARQDPLDHAGAETPTLGGTGGRAAILFRAQRWSEMTQEIATHPSYDVNATCSAALVHSSFVAIAKLTAASGIGSFKTVSTVRHQKRLPGTPLKGPTTCEVIQPP